MRWVLKAGWRAALLVVMPVVGAAACSGEEKAPAGATGCPSEPPTTNEGCRTSVTCEYGSVSCCGSSHPERVCNCGSEGWKCFVTEACRPPVHCIDAAPDVG